MTQAYATSDATTAIAIIKSTEITGDIARIDLLIFVIFLNLNFSFLPRIFPIYV
jgi:hypothetical protein